MLLMEGQNPPGSPLLHTTPLLGTDGEADLGAGTTDPTAPAHLAGAGVQQTALGTSVRAARERLGLDLNALAKKSGLEQRYVAAVEAGGESAPSATALLRLAEALELSVVDLVPRTAPTARANTATERQRVAKELLTTFPSEVQQRLLPAGRPLPVNVIFALASIASSATRPIAEWNKLVDVACSLARVPEPLR